MAQVWLVTGSSRGLGRAIVEAGLAAGNKVLATAREIESLRDDHRDEGRSSVLSPKESRSFCSVFVDGRKDWASRAWALFGCEMGCRGFLRSVVARSGAARHQGHHR